MIDFEQLTEWMYCKIILFIVSIFVISIIILNLFIFLVYYLYFYNNILNM